MVDNPKKLLTLIVAPSVVAVLSVPFGEYLIRSADNAGWFKDAGSSWTPFVATLAQSLSNKYVTGLALIGLGYVLGIWTEPLLRSRKPKPTRDQQFRSSCGDLDRMNNHTKYLVEEWKDGRHKGHLDLEYMAEVRSFFESAKRLGLVVPVIDTTKPLPTLAIVAMYSQNLLPLARDGHYEQAKRQSTVCV